uniref:complement C4-B n=1 Tax=Solea senegalensis TaxID=28829 RepID=UPI001CD8E2A1|nr:complement C4-B [Solea senegalensis]
MDCHIVSLLLLALTVETGGSTENRFLISAPHVFHVGVGEKVFVQMGKQHHNTPVILYLEHESTGTVVSSKEMVSCTEKKDVVTVELKINSAIMSRLPPPKYPPSYLLVVAESRTFNKRKFIKVLVSKHRGYIFIQTNQPAYNPTEKVHYRIFTLDHMLRPHGDTLHTSVLNAAGNRIQKSITSAKDGIIKGTFPIPDVSEMGTWTISAHFEGDNANAVSREFKVQRFVLPSFGVDIKLEQNYILLSAKHVVFTISAIYTHGEKVKGAYYCKFGVGLKPESRNQKTIPVFVKGLELTGSVQNGEATVSLPIAKINDQLQKEKNLTLAGLQERGAQVYLAVFVTDIESGEMQEAEDHLPVLSHKYTMDLSRTRSYLPPGFPLDVVVIMRHPDGSPASGVPVRTVIQGSSGQGITDQEGAMFHTFNIDSTTPLTVEVTADDLQQKKTIGRTSSSSASYLYISFTPRMYSVGDFLSVTYSTLNGQTNRFIYYMVLSRGILIKSGRLPFGSSVKDNLLITHDMVPSFRLIGYFYNEPGDVISDSVWVDVRDECEIKVKVEQKGPFEPGKQSVLDIDLHGQKAKVALLAVDKAFYALNTDNRLTAKQVFSAMQSYDLGCSYGGGRDSVSGLKDAGLSFVTHSQSGWKHDSHCDSQSSRKKRSVDLNQEMMTFKSNFSKLEHECCDHGFSLIPMTLTCQQRAKRMSLVKRNQACADIFLKCCLEAQRLMQKKIQEEAEKGLGRTASVEDIEEFFLDPASQYIRRIFPPSFAFNEIEVNGKQRYSLALPDSITTWELQIITLSAATGFCVVKPTEIKAVKRTFVSLRLPYSVKKYEQMFISPVIYNYGRDDLELAVHMEQTEGLCSPGSATTAAFVNITVKSESSQFVSFSAAPMVSGQIPIKIRLYDIINEVGIDAIEKSLNVLTEGLEQRECETIVIKLDGKSVRTIRIDGGFPDETIPNSGSNIFISAEENEFHSQAKNLLSPEKVAKLIVLPTGCLEQTMTGLAPTASALRYLDLSEQWFNLPPGKRDETLENVMQGITRILSYKKADGSYRAFSSVPSSNWVTALVVKVMSLVAQRQRGGLGEQGLKTTLPLDDISLSVRYLLSAQQTDGSFIDPHPVLHRGVLIGKDQVASMTAFITVSLQWSLDFLPEDTEIAVKASISRSTSYLMLHLEKLQHPYAIATTAYCLAVCLEEGSNITRAWTKLQALAMEGKDGCYLWTTDKSPPNQGKADSITIETTAYALLTAVALQHREWADKAACWLITQENYFGGYASSQDTLMALEALAEYELKRPVDPASTVIADFTVPHKSDIVKLVLENKKRVETSLKKFLGSQINMQLSGKGKVKVKIVKAYNLLGPKDDCTKLSIRVTVTGKVKYTSKVIETYEYYDDYDTNMGKDPIPGTEESDSHDRKRRDVDNNLSSVQTVTYRVCVSHSMNYSLTGMAIADITLLSGFEVVIADLDKLKQTPEQYIAHYEVNYGRVLIYFNELFESEECIDFDAKQTVPIGLLQPAPAVFYDYYEPNQKCTIFYSAPQRSKLVSKLCSGDVCQCAERPCHKPKMTFKSERNVRLTKNDRLQHACFFPVVDYGYIVEVLSVSVKSNFEIYKSRVIEVLRSHGDHLVKGNSIRVFVMRRQCKGELNLGRQYLIMGKDGSTTDSTGAMQYLLESNTWIEQKPTDEECKKTIHRVACRGFFTFIREYKVDGCSQ